MKLCIEIKGDIDSLMLWSLIEKYKVNLMALGNITYVYGETNITFASEIIARCSLFGDLKIELSKASQ